MDYERRVWGYCCGACVHWHRTTRPRTHDNQDYGRCKLEPAKLRGDSLIGAWPETTDLTIGCAKFESYHDSVEYWQQRTQSAEEDNRKSQRLLRKHRERARVVNKAVKSKYPKIKPSNILPTILNLINNT